MPTRVAETQRAALPRKIVALVWELADRMRANFEEQGAELGLSPALAGALMALERPLSMHELARHMRCDASNVTGIVDRLEARGLVERHVDESDRRIKNLVLTAEGVRHRDALQGRLMETSPITAGVSTADQRALRDLLARMLGRSRG